MAPIRGTEMPSNRARLPRRPDANHLTSPMKLAYMQPASEGRSAEAQVHNWQLGSGNMRGMDQHELIPLGGGERVLSHMIPRRQYKEEFTGSNF